jgi:hypothetical protein
VVWVWSRWFALRPERAISKTGRWNGRSDHEKASGGSHRILGGLAAYFFTQEEGSATSSTSIARDSVRARRRWLPRLQYATTRGTAGPAELERSDSPMLQAWAVALQVAGL